MCRNLQAEMPLIPIKVVGKLDAFLMDVKTGRIVEERHTPNDVIDGGEIWIAELLGGEDYSGVQLTYSAGNLGYGLQYTQVGIDGTATTQGMFDLENKSTITTNYVTTENDVSSPGNVIVATSTFSTGIGNGALQEAGLFSNSGDPASATDTTKRMFNRVNFATINKTTSFQLTFQWTITIGTV